MFCIVPEGVAEATLADWARGAAAARTLSRGSLTVARVPFIPQDDYDRVLWACDMNFVRGEDSFVRAQWAERPLAWHAYPQTENAHRLKLDAFLDRYTAGLPEGAALALRAFAHAWNGGGDVGRAWKALDAGRPALTAHARAWAAKLAETADLATTLVKFCLDRI